MPVTKKRTKKKTTKKSTAKVAAPKTEEVNLDETANANSTEAASEAEEKKEKKPRKKAKYLYRLVQMNYGEDGDSEGFVEVNSPCFGTREELSEWFGENIADDDLSVYHVASISLKPIQRKRKVTTTVVGF